MAEYIEKEKILESLDTNRYNPSEDPEDSYMAGWKTGFNAGTDHAIHDVICSKTADVRSVVLCSKCRYCQKEDEYTLWCTGFCNPSRLVRPDDFCSHGEAAP